MANPEWENYNPNALNEHAKITPEDALSRVQKDEELIWSCCPNCNSVLAVYIRPGKVAFGVAPILAVHQEPPSTDDR